MRFETNRTRDPFRFSLRGRAAINPYVVVPTLPDDRINDAWDARLRQPAQARHPVGMRSTMQGLENLLARYFAPGRQAA